MSSYLDDVCEFGLNHKLEKCHFCDFNTRINNVTKILVELNRRLRQVEEHSHMHLQIECDKTYNSLYDFIKSVNDRVEKLTSKYDSKESIDKDIKKIPFKCCLCDGKGEIKYQTTSPTPPYVLHNTDDCNLCQGKGIVWG